MDKGTFKILKSLLKSLEIDAGKMTNELADRAAQSRKKLFENLAGASMEHLIVLQSRIMDDMYELADKTDQEARDGTLGIGDNDMRHLSSFVANAQVIRECERLIQEKLKKMNKED